MKNNRPLLCYSLKICNHINVILNDKYEDLLQSGFGNTSVRSHDTQLALWPQLVSDAIANGLIGDVIGSSHAHSNNISSLPDESGTQPDDFSKSRSLAGQS
ncbi:MAG: hypothetical protein FWH27_05230 [Planctomycetaceae bacterium]|nr:hypothetical protein [Planctomycetaceae bacterium]